MSEQAFLAIISGKDRSLCAGVLRAFFSLIAPLYALGALLKNRLFDCGVLTAHDLGRPTVSIGNLTTGGTGKTPMVVWVVEQLVAQGHKPCVLLRGYKSKNGVSDEAQELKQLVGESAYIAPNPSRVAEAKAQLEKHNDITCFVLDDGFQHRKAKRDLDLVLIDATNPWGYGDTLPRGLLRECPCGLTRADAVIVTRTDRVSADALAQVVREVNPLALAKHGWDGFNNAPMDALKNEPVAVTCGIGNSTAFLAQAREHCGIVVLEDAKADHFSWSHESLSVFFASAQKAGATAVLITEKDFVKWHPLMSAFPLPVYRPRLSMQFTQGQDAVVKLLASKIPLK